MRWIPYHSRIIDGYVDVGGNGVRESRGMRAWI
jgi:hypothetical protein